MSELLKTKAIECESITIKHPKGDGKIELQATPQGIGIWLTKNENRKSPMISIYSFNGQTAIGITSDKLTNPNRAYQLALYVDEKTNEPTIQLIDTNDNVIFVSAEQFQQLVKNNSSFV